MKESVFLILLLSVNVKGSCVVDFDSVEKECAKPLDVSPALVFFYLTRGYAYVDVPKVEDFVTCTWRKWGYENPNGTINYNKLRSDRMLAWKLSRHCHKYLQEYKFYDEAFQRAVTDCERKTRGRVRAETVRLCIVSNYPKYVPFM